MSSLPSKKPKLAPVDPLDEPIDFIPVDLDEPLPIRLAWFVPLDVGNPTSYPRRRQKRRTGSNMEPPR